MGAQRARAFAILLAAAVVAGCSRPEQAAPASAAAPEAVAPSASLDDEVWSVKASNAVAPGTLYVFLPDGKLAIASPGSRVGLGSWRRDAAGALTMVEASRPYAVDVLELDAKVLRLRSHNPGPPVDITLEPAAAPAPVPQRFQGEWNAQPKDCGTAGNASRLRIAADSIRFHESAGSLRAVLPQAGDAELAVVARLSGEGQARLAYRQFRLSADGRTLADITDGERGGLVRQRCPGK